jgi:hypothetical protein
VSLRRILSERLPILHSNNIPRPLFDPAGWNAHTTGSTVPSLVRVAEDRKWDKCHAMLDRGEGEVNERDSLQSGLTAPLLTCHHSDTGHFCLREGRVQHMPDARGSAAAGRRRP